jgi:signal transduction histidine kinase
MYLCKRKLYSGVTVLMLQPLALFLEATAIFAVLTGSIASIISIYPGLNREAAFFILGAAACGIVVSLVSRRKRPARPDHRILQLMEGVANELKKNLQTINGLSEMISHWSAREGAEWRDTCHHLVETTRKLALFTSQLHDYARLERGALHLLEQQVDAAELVVAGLAACEDKAEHADVFIKADLSGSAELRCDATRIGQAITSLVHWIVETSPSGSSIGISLIRRADKGLEIRISNPAGRAPVAGAATLFEPPVPITGLNSLALPIARRVALLHCGNIKVEAAPGTGTSASLCLPARRVDWPELADTNPPRAG